MPRKSVNKAQIQDLALYGPGPIGLTGESQSETLNQLAAEHNARSSGDERVLDVHAQVLTRSKVGRAEESIKKALLFAPGMGLGTEIEPPPGSITGMIATVVNSSVLPQHIATMATNIDGFGHTFIAKLDPDADNLPELVANAMILEGKKGAPKPAEVEARANALKAAMVRELALVKSWFDHCVVDDPPSWIALRKRTRTDMETTGNAYWEILRNPKGVPLVINRLPVATMSVARLGEPVEVEYQVELTPLTVRKETRWRRFRRYVQAGANPGTKAVWYKEHGDPRLMSHRSGKYYASEALMRKEEPEARPATEVRHWKIYSTRSEAYGLPRWLGATNAVVGTTKAEEVNYLYFDNKSVPPLALLVSGGQVSDETIQQLKDVVENDLQGTKNFHRILILQAASPFAQGSGEVKMALQPLTSAQLQDGQFMEYLKFNSQTVGSVFRLPPLYRGDVEAFNRATAEVAVRVAEEQVFQPERDEFDVIINKCLLPELDIRYWLFKSSGPNTTDMQVRAQILDNAARIGALTLNEYRAKFGALFDNRELDALLDEWADLPVPIAVGLLLSKNPGIFVNVTVPDQEVDSEGNPTPGSSAQGPGVKPGSNPKGGAVRPGKDSNPDSSGSSSGAKKPEESKGSGDGKQAPGSRARKPNATSEGGAPKAGDGDS